MTLFYSFCDPKKIFPMKRRRNRSRTPRGVSRRFPPSLGVVRPITGRLGASLSIEGLSLVSLSSCSCRTVALAVCFAAFGLGGWMDHKQEITLTQIGASARMFVAARKWYKLIDIRHCNRIRRLRSDARARQKKSICNVNAAAAAVAASPSSRCRQILVS